MSFEHPESGIFVQNVFLDNPAEQKYNYQRQRGFGFTLLLVFEVTLYEEVQNEKGNCTCYGCDDGGWLYGNGMLCR